MCFWGCPRSRESTGAGRVSVSMILLALADAMTAHRCWQTRANTHTRSHKRVLTRTRARTQGAAGARRAVCRLHHGHGALARAREAPLRAEGVPRECLVIPRYRECSAVCHLRGHPPAGAGESRHNCVVCPRRVWPPGQRPVCVDRVAAAAGQRPPWFERRAARERPVGGAAARQRPGRVRQRVRRRLTVDARGRAELRDATVERRAELAHGVVAQGHRAVRAAFALRVYLHGALFCTCCVLSGAPTVFACPNF
jgi:hypothetical protein